MNEETPDDVAQRPEAGVSRGKVMERALGGIRWTSISLLVRIAFGIAIGIVLARLLTPADFGLVALAVVFTNLVTVFRDFGLVNALVRQTTVTEMELSTAFWLNLAFGAFWGIALAAAAWPASLLMREPRLTLVLLVLSANVFLASFGGVRRAVMNRQMRFSESARIEVQASFVGGLLAIGLAFSGAGVWSLVAQSMATTIASNLLGWPKVKHRPKMIFSKAVAKEFLGFGFHTTNTNLLSYAYRNFDNFLVGSYLGAFSLGLYDFAYKLFRQPMQNARQVLTKVMFPMLAAVQSDEAHFRDLYRRAQRYLAAVLVGGFAMLHAASGALVLGVYGPRWEPAIILLRILSLAGLCQALILPSGWIYQAKGRMDLAFRNSITFGLIPTLGAFFIGVQWGIQGVAWAVLASSVFVLYPGLRVPLGLVGLRVRDVASDLGLLILSAFVAILVGYGAAATVASVAPLAALPMVAAAVGLAYLGCLWLADAALVKDLWRVGSSVVRGKRGKAPAVLA